MVTFSRILRPAAAHEVSAISEHLARLQADMCFCPRACPPRGLPLGVAVKNDWNFFAALAAELCEAFLTRDEKDRPRAAFLRDISIFQHGEDKADDAEDGGSIDHQIRNYQRCRGFPDKRIA